MIRLLGLIGLFLGMWLFPPTHLILVGLFHSIEAAWHSSRAHTDIRHLRNLAPTKSPKTSN